MAKANAKQNEVVNNQEAEVQTTARILPDLSGILDIDDISEYTSRTRTTRYETQAQALVAAGKGLFVIPVPDDSQTAKCRQYVVQLNKRNLGGRFTSAVAKAPHPAGHWQAGDLLVRLAD